MSELISVQSHVSVQREFLPVFTSHDFAVRSISSCGEMSSESKEEKQDWINQYYKSLRKLEVRKTAKNADRFKLSYGQEWRLCDRMQKTIIPNIL